MCKRNLNYKVYRQNKKQKKMDYLLEEYNKIIRNAQMESECHTSNGKNQVLSIQDCSKHENDSLDDSELETHDDKLSQSDVIQQLQEWIVDTQTPQAHSDRLLKILRVKLLPTLPNCTKTLLKSNVNFNVEDMEVPW